MQWGAWACTSGCVDGRASGLSCQGVRKVFDLASPLYWHTNPARRALAGYDQSAGMMGLEVPGLRWGARIRPTFQEQKGRASVVLEKGLTTTPRLHNARNIATTCFGHLLA